MKQYIKLMRPFHWIKNLLLFVPLFFNGTLNDTNKFANVVIGFVAFSLIASSVYVLNDIQDVDKDRQHPKKRFRPIASGAISVSHAKCFWLFLVIISLLLMYFVGYRCENYWIAYSMPILYLIMNIGYSEGLKNIPLFDVIIIALGFVIRLFYGGMIVNVSISSALFLTVVSVSLFLGFGKRRNELQKGTKTRKVLQAYNIGFLDKIMYVCITLSLVFYALWTLESHSRLLVYTVPVAMIIVMDYCLIIESDSSDGDPAEVLKHSKSLSILLFVFIVMVFISIYIIHI
ncbi:UbiA prenyltransferase family protein [Limosilactobacillus sp.]|uniref:UbiA prenyltransferase family protein n=1 Tax=Limosilactobacillus sp. TaxID=2773925 RepID=UPI00345EF75D